MSKLFNDNFTKQVERMSRTRKQMEIKWFCESIYDFYKDMRESHKALELYEEVYDKRREVLGEKHPDTLLALGNLIYTSTI